MYVWGKGKGAPEGFVAPVTPGRIIIEAEGVSYEIAKEALRLAAQKLPITTKFVRKDVIMIFKIKMRKCYENCRNKRNDY